MLNTVKTRLPLRGGDKKASSHPTPLDVMKYEPDNAAPREKETKQSAATPKTVDFRKRTFSSKLCRCVGDHMTIEDRGVLYYVLTEDAVKF